MRYRAEIARASIESGALRGESLRQRLLSIPVSYRDTWFDQEFGFEEAPPDVPDLPRGSVPYLPCGVEEIMAMISEVPLRAGDQVVDLGAGLGRVVVLAHLLTGVPAQGIEIQEPLVLRAREKCAELGLTAVSFTHGDARHTHVDGTAFFLYAPFNGEMFRAVLARLEAVAHLHPIVLCAVGAEFSPVPWLLRRNHPSGSPALAIYDSAPHL